jgi:hypothetical protein
MKPKRRKNNYSDKELQRSATVLGYAAHVSLSTVSNYNDMSSEQHRHPT